MSISLNNNLSSSGGAEVHILLAAEITCKYCNAVFLMKLDVVNATTSCPKCVSIYTCSSRFLEEKIVGELRRTPNKRQGERKLKKPKGPAGRKPVGSSRRKYLQLNLDPITIDVLDELSTNRSGLFEGLLKLYPPYMEVLAKAQVVHTIQPS